MRNELLENWEKELKQILDELDVILEDNYQGRFALHPVRPERGRTANPAHDGLFNISAKYTLGIGSKLGEGYGIELRLSTLQSVPADEKAAIQATAKAFIGKRLAEVFPHQSLKVDEDGTQLKIFGDLGL